VTTGYAVTMITKGDNTGT